MHNGMTLTQIQGQGHRDLTVAKLSKLRQSGIPSQNVPQNWAFAKQSEISGANLCESIFTQNKRKIQRIFADVCR